MVRPRTKDDGPTDDDDKRHVSRGGFAPPGHVDRRRLSKLVFFSLARQYTALYCALYLKSCVFAKGDVAKLKSFYNSSYVMLPFDNLS